MSNVKLEQVSKRFNQTQAVSNLSFEVGDGEFVILLGPTGAGKTTTLRLIAGLEKADKGSIALNNKNVTSLQPAERDIAFVFQQYSLYPNYTVYNNLAFPLKSPLRRLSPSEIDRKVRRVAKILHIENKLDNKSTQLSGGEMQRVAIGRALVREPNIFLMDEPLSSLDAKLRGELRLELKNIQVNLGATILYVTHDHVEATSMGDRIGILKEGELIQIDTPENIYQNPNSIYVANRLGTPKINVLPFRTIKSGGLPTAEFIAFRPESVILNGEDGNSARKDELGDSSISFSAKVETIQNLGVEEIISMTFDDNEIRAVTRPQNRYRPGQTIDIGLTRQNMLFFDRNSQRISV